LAWGWGLDSTVSGQGPVAGCCECGDEPSGSCATVLVKYSVRPLGTWWSILEQSAMWGVTVRRFGHFCCLHDQGHVSWRISPNDGGRDGLRNVGL
jgi:hypothetical protein